MYLAVTKGRTMIFSIVVPVTSRTTIELEDDEEPCAGMYELKPVYTYSMEYTSYEDAVEVCRAMDQELALPKSEEENEALRNFAEGHHPLTMQVKRNPLNADNWVRLG